jgi:hypothetical protein
MKNNLLPAKRPNNRVQWSAASKFFKFPSVLCAAPTDAGR